MPYFRTNTCLASKSLLRMHSQFKVLCIIQERKAKEETLRLEKEAKEAEKKAKKEEEEDAEDWEAAADTWEDLDEDENVGCVHF